MSIIHDALRKAQKVSKTVVTKESKDRAEAFPEEKRGLRWILILVLVISLSILGFIIATRTTILHKIRYQQFLAPLQEVVIKVIKKEKPREIETPSISKPSPPAPPHKEVDHINLGMEHYRKGAIKEAISEFKTAIAIKPDIPEVYNNLGIALRRAGRLQEALSAYKEAIRLRPDYPEAYNNMGVVNNLLKRYNEAVSSLTEALRLKPNYPEAHLNLAIAFEKLGRMPEAEMHYHTFMMLAGPEDQRMVEIVRRHLQG